MIHFLIRYILVDTIKIRWYLVKGDPQRTNELNMKSNRTRAYHVISLFRYSSGIHYVIMQLVDGLIGMNILMMIKVFPFTVLTLYFTQVVIQML